MNGPRLHSLAPGFLLLLYVACLALPLQAPAAVTTDGSLGAAQTLTGPDFMVGSDLGQINGGNLFHSFGEFSLDTGESATFTGPASIDNIISRVTGGSASNIDGLIRSQIDGANFFFVNPSGVMFGPNASLDVSGSFHMSTADYLRLGEGDFFYANLSQESVLSVSAPAAFGFLGPSAAPIELDRSQLEVGSGQAISLVGGDITIAGAADSAEVSAPDGQINLAAAASAGEVVTGPVGAEPALEMEGFPQLGTITLAADAIVSTSGTTGGAILVRSGRFYMDAAVVIASATEAPNTAGPSEPHLGVSVHAREEALLDNASELGATVTADTGARGGDVEVEAGRLEVANQSGILAVVAPGSTGLGGDVRIAADHLIVRDGAGITASTSGLGNSGDITVVAEAIKLQNGGSVSTSFAGMGDGGNVSVTVQELTIEGDGNPYTAPFTGIFSNSFNGGRGGSLALNAGSVNLSHGAVLEVAAYSTGQGGDLNITAERVSVQDRSGIWGGTYWTGDAGDVTLDVGQLRLADASFITTSGLFGAGGNSGNLRVTADQITIAGPESSADPFGTDFTGISTSAGPWGGDGGHLWIETADLILNNRSSLNSTSYGPGLGGTITLTADRVEVTGGSNLLANAFGSGDAGDVELDVGTLRITGAHPELFTDILGLEVISVSGIAAQNGVGTGNGGTIRVRAESLELLDGGRITVETFGNGAGGTIDVTANSVRIAGENADFIDLVTTSGIGDPEAARSGILSNTVNIVVGEGAQSPAGDIRIEAGVLTLEDRGRIASQTDTAGAGGNISIQAGAANLSGDAVISATSLSGQPGAGTAGNIELAATVGVEIDNSRVVTAATEAQGGDISIAADDIRVSGGSLVSAESSGTGDAGGVQLFAGSTLEIKDSSVSTEAIAADGGNIAVLSGNIVNLVRGTISASVGGGEETIGGNVGLDARLIALNESRIVANAFEGRGGNIRIVADAFLADPNSTVDASSELGVDGLVDIRAAVKQVAENPAPLPKDYLGADELLLEPCLARALRGQASSFVFRGREGLPMEPGGPLPSPLP